MSIDLNYWMWKEKVQWGRGVRYLTPRSDPNVYEDPFDALFSSKEDAINVREELMFNERDCYECGESFEISPTGIATHASETLENFELDADHVPYTLHPHEAESWVLVHYTGTLEET